MKANIRSPFCVIGIIMLYAIGLAWSCSDGQMSLEPTNSSDSDSSASGERVSVIPRGLARKKRAAPLDLNAEIDGTLKTVTSVLGTLGKSTSGLVFGLTGISTTDCAGSFKDVDFNKITCSEFIEILSECESLGNIKNQLKKAQKKLRRRRGPCN